MCRNRNHQGFSLVETLVVISTTALLFGMLLPSLQTARQQAQKTLCLSNLRQMAIAAHNYGAIYDGHYPLAYYNQREDAILRFHAWDFTTWKEWSSTTATSHVQPGLLWAGQTIEQVQQCPAFKGADNALADPYTGYNYNTSYIGLNDTLSPINSAQTTDVRRPAETALFGDGQCTDGGANKYMRAPFSHPGDTLLPDSARHAGARTPPLLRPHDRPTTVWKAMEIPGGELNRAHLASATRRLPISRPSRRFFAPVRGAGGVSRREATRIGLCV